MSTMIDTHEATPFETAYNRHLAENLTRLADGWYGELAKARAAFIASAFPDADGSEREWYGNEGPFAHALGWRGDDVIAAEFRYALACNIHRALDPNREGGPIAASEVLDGIVRMCKQAIKAGATSTWSGHMSNVSARVIAATAVDILDRWSFASLVHDAYYDAKREIVGPDPEMVTVLKANRRAIVEKRSRSRSEAKIAGYTATIDGIDAELAVFAADADARFAAAGGTPAPAYDGGF